MLKPGRIDAFGFLVLAIWLGTMQTVLNKGQDEDWFNSNFICSLSVISVIAFVAFVVQGIQDPRTARRLAGLCRPELFVRHHSRLDRLSPLVWHHESAAADGGKA